MDTQKTIFPMQRQGAAILCEWAETLCFFINPLKNKNKKEYKGEKQQARE
jgi:hypothetical protein